MKEEKGEKIKEEIIGRREMMKKEKEKTEIEEKKEN